MRPSRAAYVLAGLVALVVLTSSTHAPTAPSGATSPRGEPAAALPAPSSVRVGGPERPADVPAAGGGASTRYLVTTNDSLAVPNDGLETNLTAFPRASFPPDSSFQTGAEEVIGGFEAVFGLFTNDQTRPTAFYSIFTNSTDQPVRNLYWAGLSISPGAPYDFRLQETNGTTWTLTVNGAVFGNDSAATFDFGAARSTWLGGLSFSEVAIYSSTTTVPNSYTATTALAVHQPGGSWYLPLNAMANFTGPSGAAYGIEGRSELGGLAPGEVVSGTALAAVRNDEVLWTTGPVPVDVALVVSPTTTTGLGFVNVAVNVTTPSGTPLGAVPVYVEDTLHGTAAPSTVLTEVNGEATTILTLANESVAVSDTVRAIVTILGFVGSGSTGLTVGPSVEIVVTANAPNLAIAPGTSASVTFETSSTEGQPYPGVALVLTPLAGTGNGALSGVLPEPSSGTTDSSGSLSVSLLAPAVTGSYKVLAVVSDYGVWGRTTVSVTVRAPPPTLWEKYGTSVILPTAGAAAAVVALVAIVLLLRRRRGPRRRLPEMDLRRLRKRDGRGDEPAGGEPPDVSRTPPASGTP